MLGARASRLVNNTASSSSDTRAQRTVRISTRTEEQIKKSIHKWRQLGLKMLHIIHYATMKTMVKASLGADTFLRMYQSTKTLPNYNNNTPSQQLRIISGWAMGQRLKEASKSKKILNLHDPDVCPHLTTHLVHGGNGKALWWVCNACGSRYERFRMEENLEPTEHTIMTWGKYSGKTFGQIFHNHREYIEWALMTWNVNADVSPQMKRFVEWILKEEVRQATPGMDFEMADAEEDII